MTTRREKPIAGPYSAGGWFDAPPSGEDFGTIPEGGQVVASMDGVDWPMDGEVHHIVVRGKRRWLDGKRLKDRVPPSTPEAEP